MKIFALSQKIQERTVWKKKRQAISRVRQKVASQTALRVLSTTFSHHAFILSYTSFDSELNTWPLNESLAQTGRLLLPRVDGNLLKIFFVDDLETQLEKSPFGFLQPIPSCCPVEDFSFVSLALVPGLAFDCAHHRLGYGKGYYDRFLARFPHVLSIGVGFIEQKAFTPLSLLPTDVPVNKLFFF